MPNKPPNMEGCLRVPFIARWPGHIPTGAVNNEIVHAIHLFSTLASIAEAKVPDDRPIDGIRVWWNTHPLRREQPTLKWLFWMRGLLER